MIDLNNLQYFEEMERDDSDATLSDGSDLSYDVPMETNKGKKDYKGVLDTLKDMSLSLRRSEVRLN